MADKLQTYVQLAQDTAWQLGRVAESNFCGTPFLQTNQEKNGNIASKAAT